MNTRNLLRSRRATAVLAGILYVAGRSLAQFLGLDDSAGNFFAQALGLGNTGLLLVWAIGHCDGMDGPVVLLAKKALETGNVDRVLPWVRAEDETEITHAFDHAMSVRKLGPQARELADRYFFETLVRIHRAGEGAPFTGLKPAGRDLGPAIPAADRALEDGSVDAVIRLVTDAVTRGIRERFQAAWSKRRFDPNDVEAGREYVEAYVPYIHFVERAYAMAKESTHGHSHESGQSVAHVH
ncbi:MAG: DUF6448 family protein [Pseudomonadota bacterium]